MRSSTRGFFRACGSLGAWLLLTVQALGSTQEFSLEDGDKRSINGLSIDTRFLSEPGKVLRWVVTYRQTDEPIELEMVREENAGKQLLAGAKEIFRYWMSCESAASVPLGVFSLSCEDKFGGIDGSSASAAFATMLRSFSDDFEIDDLAAVTGDLSVEGRVLLVGGVYQKIRGAILHGCTRVVIPVANTYELIDSVILHGPSILGEIEIYGANEIDEVIAVLRRDASPSRARASEIFAQVQALSEARLRSGTLKRSKEFSGLAEQILEVAPRHLSAQVFLSWHREKLPTRLTLRRSVDELDYEWSRALQVDPQASPESRSEPRDIRLQSKERLEKGISRIGALRPKLSERSLRLASAYDEHLRQLRVSVRANDKRLQQERCVEQDARELERARRRLDNPGGRPITQADRMLLQSDIRAKESALARSQGALQTLGMKEGQEVERANELNARRVSCLKELHEELHSAEALIHRR